MWKRKDKLSEGKRNIIANLIEEYDIQTSEDIQDTLKYLLGGTIENMLKAELDNHIIQKLAAYIILGINEEGKKEVLSIQIGENESSKYC